MTKDLAVKICGLTNETDAEQAMELGADYLGFIFYAGSPRAVVPETVQGILSALPDARGVGVFVNEPPDRVAAIAETCGLHAVQIHGDEEPDPYRDFSFPVWRAVHVGAEICRPEPEQWPAQRYVLDAAVPGAYGGTGVTADWGAAARIAARVPALLAGGLTPENVTEAIRCVRPAGVDVSSGVEAEPGRKDPARVARFIRAARGEPLEIGVRPKDNS